MDGDEISKRSQELSLSKKVRHDYWNRRRKWIPLCGSILCKKKKCLQMGFAPDADFPIINAEKGIASLIFTQTGSADTETIQFFQAGNRTNMVPDEAFAFIFGGLIMIKEKFHTFASEHGYYRGSYTRRSYGKSICSRKIGTCDGTR